MRKIILATDFSDFARAAADFAIELFGKEDTEYILLNSYHEGRTGTNVVISVNDFLRKNSIIELERELELFQKKYDGKINMKYISYYGTVSKAINTIYDEEGASFAVTGTKGANGLETFIMGSNTLDAVNEVNIPLLVVPSGVDVKIPKKFALAADYKKVEDISILNSMKELAEIVDASVDVIHVQNDNHKATVEEAMEGLDVHYALSGITHDYHTINNASVVNGIDGYVKENDVELLTLIPRQHGFFERIFNKSITAEMAKLADVPLLILREKVLA